jgi:hypothetical protein
MRPTQNQPRGASKTWVCRATPTKPAISRRLILRKAGRALGEGKKVTVLLQKDRVGAREHRPSPKTHGLLESACLAALTGADLKPPRGFLKAAPKNTFHWAKIFIIRVPRALLVTPECEVTSSLRTTHQKNRRVCLASRIGGGG